MNHALLIILTIVLVAGCSSLSPEPTLGSLIVPPTLGSTFTFEQYDINVKGDTISGSKRIREYKVIDVNGQYFGKDSVWALSSSSLGNMMLYCIDNGNLYFCTDAAKCGKPELPWIRMHLNAGAPIVDSSTFCNKQDSMSILTTSTFAGTQSNSIGNASHMVFVTAVDVNQRFPKAGAYAPTSTLTFSILPSIGTDAMLIAVPRDSTKNGWKRTLISYTIK